MDNNSTPNKIDPANQLQITNEVIDKLLKQYSIIDYTYEIITEGIENTSLIVSTGKQKYVLRIYRQLKKTTDDILLEIQFQKLLKNKGLPIPEIRMNNDGDDVSIVKINNKYWQVILMEYLGKTDFASYTPELLREMAITQAKMHQLGIAFAKDKVHTKRISELNETISQRHPTRLKNKKHQNFLQRATAFHLTFENELPYGYNHLDYDTYGNILIKNNKIMAILDFDDLAYSPCIVCLGYTLWSILFSTNQQELLYQYIRYYETVRPLTKNEREILPQIMLFRNYAIGAIEMTVRKRYIYMQQIMDMEKDINNLKF